MKRILEPEQLMDDEEQARAYAAGNWEQAHSQYPLLFQQEFARHPPKQALVLDLGCGPLDVTIRFANAFPGFHFHAVDGAAAMLKYAQQALARCPHLAPRFQLLQGMLPELALPENQYPVILCNNLLHHLPDPAALWNTVKRYAAPGAIVFVTDLRRPENREQAERLLNQYAAGEPPLLRRDFFNSLLAAFTPDEVQTQLAAARLDRLHVRTFSDRHLLVSGIV